MNDNASLQDAMIFVAAGCVMALLGMRLRPVLVKKLLANVLVMLVGLAGFSAVVYWGSGIRHTAFVAFRELALVLVGVGFIGAMISFVIQGVLARLETPRILSDVIAAFALVAFA